jgi:hypothetical protein
MDRLNRAGVPDDRIRALCALGTHGVLTLEQMKTKVGEEDFAREAAAQLSGLRRRKRPGPSCPPSRRWEVRKAPAIFIAA